MRPATVGALACLLAVPLAASAQKWGTLEGRVVFSGDKVPPQALAKVDTDKAVCLKNGPVPDEEWVINPRTRGVRWVVVWLAKDDGGKADSTAKLPINPALPKPKKEVVMDQPCCRFEPRVVVLVEGQTFVGRNSSTLKHNMNITGSRPNIKRGQNLALGAGQSLSVKGLKACEIPNLVQCNLHKWMRGHVFVFPHPYFAVTDADGKFEIKGAPAGTYRLMMWHDGAGWANGRQGKPVTVRAGKVTDLGKFEVTK